MKNNSIHHLVWQIPILLAIPLIFMPSLQWPTELFGAWPLWLAMWPALYLTRRLLVAPHRIKLAGNAQVLVFPQVRNRNAIRAGTQQKAA